MALPDGLGSVGNARNLRSRWRPHAPDPAVPADASAAAASRFAVHPDGFHARTAARPSGSYLGRAVSAFRAAMPDSEAITARLRPGSAR
jgi:hypothetical protein